MNHYNPDDWLTNAQYDALFALYNEFHEAYQCLPDYIQEAFFARLYSQQ